MQKKICIRHEKTFHVKELTQGACKIEYDADKLHSNGYGSVEEYIANKHGGNPWKAVAAGEVVVAIWLVAKYRSGHLLRILYGKRQMGNMTRKQIYEKLDSLMEKDLLDYNVWKNGSTDEDILLIEWMNWTVRDDVARMLDDASIPWDCAESYAIDTETGRAYESVVYHGCVDYITTEDDVIGRDRIEEWNDEERAMFIEEHYLDNHDNALPCWFDVPENRYEYVSCDFEAGWYGRHDDPREILKKARERGEHIFFKIASSQPFATRFCVYRKKDSDAIQG